MSYLLGLFGVLGLGFLWQFVKNKNLQALLTNLAIKTVLNEKDQQIAKDKGLLEAEKQKREELKNHRDSTDELVDYFNNKKND